MPGVKNKGGNFVGSPRQSRPKPIIRPLCELATGYNRRWPSKRDTGAKFPMFPVQPPGTGISPAPLLAPGQEPGVGAGLPWKAHIDDEMPKPTILTPEAIGGNPPRRDNYTTTAPIQTNVTQSAQFPVDKRLFAD
jgi:hypothetical protein